MESVLAIHSNSCCSPVQLVLELLDVFIIGISAMTTRPSVMYVITFYPFEEVSHR